MKLEYGNYRLLRRTLGHLEIQCPDGTIRRVSTSTPLFDDYKHLRKIGRVYEVIGEVYDSEDIDELIEAGNGEGPEKKKVK